MRRSESSELVRDPIGRYYEGNSFMLWVQSPTRLGAAHRSPLEIVDQATAMSLFSIFTHSQMTGPLDLFHDLSAAVDIDATVFAYVEMFMKHFGDLLAARTRRLAVIRPPGLAGAAVSGVFHERVASRFDAKLCHDRAEAYHWLSVDEPHRLEIEELYTAFSRPELIRSLHTALTADLKDATIERVARAMSSSVRSLQRRIAECGTSFSDELTHVRMLAAEAMLVQSSAKIEAIARELGFRSVAAFTTMFGRVRGESPSAFRERYQR